MFGQLLCGRTDPSANHCRRLSVLSVLHVSTGIAAPPEATSSVTFATAIREAARMKKVHRSKIRHGRVSSELNFGSFGIGSFGETALHGRLRWLFVTCVVLVCLGIFAARNGAEQVDSGWAVSVPSPLARS